MSNTRRSNLINKHSQVKFDKKHLQVKFDKKKTFAGQI